VSLKFHSEMGCSMSIKIGILFFSIVAGLPNAFAGSTYRYNAKLAICADQNGVQGLNPNPGQTTIETVAAQFECVDLSSENMTYWQIQHAYLPGTRFSKGTTLYGTTFIESDLSGADFRGIQSGGTYFTRSTLQDSDLRGADLTYAHFDHANLKNAKFDDKTLLPFSKAEALAQDMIFVP
jgi:uncharacterized protein YjbI with pentapeptide repeats